MNFISHQILGLKVQVKRSLSLDHKIYQTPQIIRREQGKSLVPANLLRTKQGLQWQETSVSTISYILDSFATTTIKINKNEIIIIIYRILEGTLVLV